MKRIYYWFLLFLVMVVGVSCSTDTDNPYNYTPSLEIEKSDVCFDAPASTGTVLLNTDKPVNVEIDADWCNASVSNNTVQVSVTQNNSLQGRSAKMIIRSQQDSVKVTVHQEGIKFEVESGDNVAFSDNGETKSFKMKSNVPVELSTSASWLHASQSDGQMVVVTDKNEEGHLRRAYVKVGIGAYQDSICVNQFDFSTDIAGDYYLVYKDTKADSQYMAKTRLSKSGQSYRLTLLDVGLSIPLTFNEEKCEIQFNSAQYVGIYQGVYVYTAMADLAEEKTTLYPSAAMSGNLVYEKTEIGETVSCQIKDNGSWTGYNINGLLLYSFTKRDPIGENAKSAIMIMREPRLLKII